jgi:ABC-type polysaccharide/polyol phosphate transport system ATPase subunit
LPSGSDLALRVDDLCVRFKTTSESKPNLSSRVRRLRRQRRTSTHVEALRGVTFEVPRGAVYAVIGGNGAGKSTLLRTIAGILRPTSGEVSLYQRVTPFLSLGVGFNKELTGRENILLGGLALGLEPDRIREHEEAIMDFAELGSAIDSPMRTYSSGMGGRLGFAVCSHLDPETILIDESLAAGDAPFKAKCRDRIALLCESRCTVVLVSHGLGVVKRLAHRTLWLSKGEIQGEGPTDEVVNAYLASEGISPDETTMEDM